jgi:NAD(P)H-dependent FMN reductase
VFAGKVAAMVSASPGVLGGMRAQIALQISLNKLGLLVIPNSFALGLAHQAFDEKWLLKDANADKSVRGLGAVLVTTANTLAPKSNHSECGTMRIVGNERQVGHHTGSPGCTGDRGQGFRRK